ncbi:hypothetical protein EEW87_001545 [Janibacter melonis]|uniref:Uncharacterized protein n=1 Tax=Janibacter melonis TaxID=262209 RepID=A0A5P8FJH0_9MICO|nr:sulfite exporter TauE/SafE family protein [Janibacter melonis]MCM3555796.1 sulfite exporter TauE/SafE family protein [Janibacter melonis]QFQ29301.1 hypothetical protein EEW87_001545 [Janibacter melonis]
MLSSITPLGERGRASRWSVTAAAYVISSALAGALLGVLLGAVGSVVPDGVLGSPAVLGLLALLLLLGAVLDLRAGGHAVPSWRRQVDEAWIGRYRGWVTGVGFGAQLGLGFVTIITSTTTYAVYLFALLASTWWAGGLVGLTFGLVRALPLLRVRRAQTPSDLHDTFRTLRRWAQPVARVAAIALVLSGAVLLAAALTGVPA